MARSPRTTAFQRRQAAQARKRRDKVEARAVPRMAKALSRYFAGMAQRLESRLPQLESKELKEANPSALVLAWGTEEAKLYDVLKQEYITIAEGAFADASALGVTAAFSLNSRGMEKVIGNLGHQVKGINEESRQRLISIINTGINNGEHPSTIAKSMLGSVRGWAGLEDLTKSRAYTIARTETAHAYTWSSAAAYRESGIVQKVVCHDSASCGWIGHSGSELANGTHRTLLEMELHPTSHPNCVRAFSPAFGDEPVAARARQPEQPKAPGTPTGKNFDGLPDVLTSSQIDAAIARGETEFFRGMTGTKAFGPGGFSDQFRTGQHYIGHGLFGRGTYVATEGQIAGTSTAREIGKLFGQGGTVMRGTIKADAKLIGYTDLEKEWIGAVNKFRGTDDLFSAPLTMESATQAGQQYLYGGTRLTRQGDLPAHLTDPGLYARHAGYDGIHVPFSNIAGGEIGDQFVMLNRTAIRVQNTDLSPVG